MIVCIKDVFWATGFPSLLYCLPPIFLFEHEADTFWCFGRFEHLMRTVMALQSTIDYTCGIGIAVCVSIQQCSSCYEPTTLQNNASFAFNSYYYQKNQSPTSCDFGGSAAVTTTNASKNFGSYIH